MNQDEPFCTTEVLAQASILEEFLDVMVDLKAERIARESGVPLAEIREAMQEGCQERMHTFANEHDDLNAPQD